MGKSGRCSTVRASDGRAPGCDEVLSENLDAGTDYDGVRVLNPLAGS